MCQRGEAAVHEMMRPVVRIIRFQKEGRFRTTLAQEPIAPVSTAIHGSDRQRTALTRQLFTREPQERHSGLVIIGGIMADKANTLARKLRHTTPPEGAARQDAIISIHNPMRVGP